MYCTELYGTTSKQYLNNLEGLNQNDLHVEKISNLVYLSKLLKTNFVLQLQFRFFKILVPMPLAAHRAQVEGQSGSAHLEAQPSSSITHVERA
jgi:hypothetical protein